MQVVGKHLAEFAVSNQGKSPDDELFARSAFNRYYYAVFLASLQLIKETTGAQGMPHKVLPEYLIGRFQNIMKRQMQTGFKSGVLTNSSRASMLTAVRENTLLLKDLLVTAYSVRVLADYEPEVRCDYKDNTYSLGAATLSAAGNWINRAQMHCKNLHKLWKDLGN